MNQKRLHLNIVHRSNVQHTDNTKNNRCITINTIEILL